MTRLNNLQWQGMLMNIDRMFTIWFKGMKELILTE